PENSLSDYPSTGLSHVYPRHICLGYCVCWVMFSLCLISFLFVPQRFPKTLFVGLPKPLPVFLTYILTTSVSAIASVSAMVLFGEDRGLDLFTSSFCSPF